jgi:hypothetical protein
MLLVCPSSLLETSIDGTCAIYDTAQFDRWNREKPKETHPVVKFRAYVPITRVLMTIGG